ncbi:MAG: hypothetical protein GY847_29265 [Proteobacteria bacterium]|nr:hypothetical protein [Pseudomonadota bacterium]
MARRIRVWRENKMFHATYECVDRMFLLKPSGKVNNIIGASLGRALNKHPVRLHSVTTNINHLEIVFSLGPYQQDNASRFLQCFAGLAARGLNRLCGREGHFWAGRARVEEIISDSKAEKLLGYGACNTVKDGLVDKASHWKGFSTNDALGKGKRLLYDYVNRTKWWRCGADHKEVDPKKYTEQVEIVVYPLPSWIGYSVDKRQSRFRAIVRDHEELARLERKVEGITRVKGMERINKESPFSKPKNPRRRTPQPLCHADTKEEYRAYEAEYKEIVKVHRTASAAYRSGYYDTEFPPGTFRPPLVTIYQQAA